MNKKERRQDNIKRCRERYRKLHLDNDKEKIQCVICGEWFRKVGAHITQKHGMTAREYREKYGFDVKKGQLPKDLKEKLGKNAIKNETYKNLEKGKIFRFKKGDKAGNYKRSKQTLLRLKTKSKSN